MKLGFFTMPIHPLGKDWRQSLREDREAFILADELGFTEGYVGEHVTDRAENITSCTMFIATPDRRHQAHQARHRHRQHAEHPSGRRRRRRSRCSTTCSTAASSSASARAGCCRTPRCSAISTPTATRCSSKPSTRCWRSGPASRHIISRASTGTSAIERQFMPDLGQGYRRRSRCRSRIRRSSSRRWRRSPRASPKRRRAAGIRSRPTS